MQSQAVGQNVKSDPCSFTNSILEDSNQTVTPHISVTDGGGGDGLDAKSCPTLATPWTVVPLSMGFPQQEYWGGLPFPPPGDLPNPGIEPVSPALQADPLPLSRDRW